MEAPSPKAAHPLAVKAGSSPGTALCAAIWALRHKLNDMTIEVPVEEIEKFQKSLDYHEQQAVLRLTPTHRGLYISMVDATSQAAIVQSESDEDDQRQKDKRAGVKALIESIPQLITEHRAMLASGVDSESLVRDIHEAALAAYQVAR